MAMVPLTALGLPLPIFATCGLENTWGKDKIECNTCAWQPILETIENEEESVILAALKVKGNYIVLYVLDLCLERDCYDSGHSKTKFSQC